MINKYKISCFTIYTSYSKNSVAMNFESKVALVTGGCSGIGLAYVKELLRNGIKGVSIVDINEADGCKIEQELKCKFGQNRIIFVKADVCDTTEVEESFEQTVKYFKSLDIVINNAGILDEVNFEKTINVNLVAGIRIIKLALSKYLPKYKNGEEGIIVNTASIVGLTYTPLLPVYSATKHALIAFAKICAQDYKDQNIKILTICPGMTATPLLSCIVNFDGLEKAKLHQAFALSSAQQPEKVGEALITVLKHGINESVWICNQKPVYEFNLVPALL